jgi:superfamily II DNA/RNA helicase
MKHSERKAAFEQFDKSEKGILISTDVASRGLDFKNVQWVIQFDIHPSLKEYANRLGRTARLNTVGSGLVFVVDPDETKFTNCLTTYGATMLEMNRFKLLKEFTLQAQKLYNKEGRGTRVFTNNDVEVEDEKFEILLFIKLMLRDVLKANPELEKLEKTSYNSASMARHGYQHKLRRLFKSCEIEDERAHIPRKKTEERDDRERKMVIQKAKTAEFDESVDQKFKDFVRRVYLGGRDVKEKNLMKLKYDRMNSAMRKVVKRSNMEFE